MATIVLSQKNRDGKKRLAELQGELAAIQVKIADGKSSATSADLKAWKEEEARLKVEQETLLPLAKLPVQREVTDAYLSQWLQDGNWELASEGGEVPNATALDALVDAKVAEQLPGAIDAYLAQIGVVSRDEVAKMISDALADYVPAPKGK